MTFAVGLQSNYNRPMTNHPNVMDLTGQRFGRLVVLSRAPNNRFRGARWNCLCDCGTKTVVRALNLRNESTKSCGCFKKERDVERNTRHGHGAPGRNTPTYSSWQSMRWRCRNDRRYVGRISICQRWQLFEHFLADMGERPDGTSLDRIDVLGNYEPRNCRWATPKEQANNRRRKSLPAGSLEWL